MDDALHYLQSRNLQGNHCTRECPPFSIESQPKTNGHQDPNALISNGHNIHNGHNGHNGHGSNGLNGHSSYHSCKESSSEGPKLLVWSAADEKALGRTKQVYEPFYNTRISGSSTSLAQFAYTLAARRSHLLWRTFALCGGDSGDDLSIAKPSRSSSENGLAFIFTGQGAQYANMGLELLHYPIFEQTLRKAEQSFRSFGATWGLFGKTSGMIQSLKLGRRSRTDSYDINRCSGERRENQCSRVQSTVMYCPTNCIGRTIEEFQSCTLRRCRTLIGGDCSSICSWSSEPGCSLQDSLL